MYEKGLSLGCIGLVLPNDTRVSNKSTLWLVCSPNLCDVGTYSTFYTVYSGAMRRLCRGERSRTSDIVSPAFQPPSVLSAVPLQDKSEPFEQFDTRVICARSYDLACRLVCVADYVSIPAGSPLPLPSFPVTFRGHTELSAWLAVRT